MERLIYLDNAATTAARPEVEMCIRDRLEKVAALAEKYAIKRLDGKYDRNLRANVILEKNIQSVTFNESNRLVSDTDAFSLIQHKLDQGASKWGGRNIAMNGSSIFHIDGANLLTEEQANTIMKYSSQKSLLEELRTAGFTIPKNCASQGCLQMSISTLWMNG